MYGLTKKVLPYPISRNVKTVSLCIGVNDNYKDVGIKDLMNTIKRTFPNSTIYIIQGSWGWGGLKHTGYDKVKKYYKRYEELGGTIIETPIGKGDPHCNCPVYKKIGKAIDNILL